MKEPFPSSKPREITRDILAIDNGNEIKILLQSGKNPDVDFILKNFNRIELSCKYIVAQFLALNGVDIELIPEYRQEEYLFKLVKKIKYKCGCIDIINSYERSFEKPEGFKKTSEFGEWCFIRYYGEEIHTEENSNELCSSCYQFSVEGVLKYIEKFECVRSIISIGNKTYIAIEDIRYDWNYKKKIVNSRFVVVLNHDNLSMEMLKKFVCWPKGYGKNTNTKTLRAIIDYCLQIEDLPKIIGINSDIDLVVRKRLERCL